MSTESEVGRARVTSSEEGGRPAWKRSAAWWNDSGNAERKADRSAWMWLLTAVCCNRMSWWVGGGGVEVSVGACRESLETILVMFMGKRGGCGGRKGGVLDEIREEILGRSAGRR